MKTKKGIKIAIISLLICGTVVIALAVFLLYNLFSTGVKSADGLSNSLSDFIILYSDNQSGRDLSEGLEVISSTCEISDDEKSFTYSLAIKNTKKNTLPLVFQTFANENFVAAYGSRVTNPILRHDFQERLEINAAETKTFTYRGVIFGSGEDAIEEFKQNMEFVYLETFFSNETGRVMLPVSFT